MTTNNEKKKKIRKKEISLGISGELLARIDDAAAKIGISRAAYIAIAADEKLRREGENV